MKHGCLWSHTKRVHTRVCVCYTWKVEAKGGDGTESQTGNAGTHTPTTLILEVASISPPPSSEAALSPLLPQK